MVKIQDSDISKASISSERHEPTHDANSINQSTEKASKDANFIIHALGYLNTMEFPAYKNNILDHVRKGTADSNVIALFQGLDGYIKFKDLYHVQKALEVNNTEEKTDYQITDETRNNPSFRTRDLTVDNSTKNREAVNRDEERTDYPEVTPTAMSNFACSMCGKPFQSQHDLIQHERFERGDRSVK
jgi:hypothetical protein